MIQYIDKPKLCIATPLLYVRMYRCIKEHLLLQWSPLLYTQVVEWFLKYTNRLPSDTECQKCLLAPAPDDLDEATRSDLLHNRTKCFELIMKVLIPYVV